MRLFNQLLTTIIFTSTLAFPAGEEQSTSNNASLSNNPIESIPNIPWPRFDEGADELIDDLPEPPIPRPRPLVRSYAGVFRYDPETKKIYPSKVFGSEVGRR